MSKAEQLVNKLKKPNEFEQKLKSLQQTAKSREEEVKKSYLNSFKLDLDEVRKKQGFYIKIVNKKQTPLPQNLLNPYLEAALQLEKNKSALYLQQKKLSYQQWKATYDVLEQVNKHYGLLAESVKMIYYQKNKQINELNATIKDLKNKLQALQSKYDFLASEKMSSNSSESHKDGKITGIGVIPFLCDKMEMLFQQNLAQMNFGQAELQIFKKQRNNILGKFQYAVQLLKRKQLEKDRMDEESNLQMKYYRKQVEIYKKQALQAKQKQQEMTELLKIAEKELQRQIDFIYKQKKKYDEYPIQIAERQRIIKKLQNDKVNLKKKYDDLQRRTKKSLGKRVEAMVAAKAAKDAKQAKERELKAIQQKQKQQEKVEKPDLKSDKMQTASQKSSKSKIEKKKP